MAILAPEMTYTPKFNRFLRLLGLPLLGEDGTLQHFAQARDDAWVHLGIFFGCPTLAFQPQHFAAEAFGWHYVFLIAVAYHKHFVSI